MRIEAGRDAHIVQAETGREGMRRLVLPSMIPVVSELTNYLFSKFELTSFRVFQLQERFFNLRFLRDGFDQTHLHRPQLSENFLNLCGFHARFEIVQQWIIYMIPGFEEIRVLPA